MLVVLFALHARRANYFQKKFLPIAFLSQSVEIGPCKATKPQLMELAATSPIPIGYVYEENLEDFLDIFVQISGFPTYILFQNGQEKARVKGTNFAELEQMIHNHNTASA